MNTGRNNALGATRPKPRQAEASLTALGLPLNPLKGTSPLPSPRGAGVWPGPRRTFKGNLIDVLHACTLLNGLRHHRSK